MIQADGTLLNEQICGTSKYKFLTNLNNSFRVESSGSNIRNYLKGKSVRIFSTQTELQQKLDTSNMREIILMQGPFTRR